ncbi:MAG: signal peptidase I [Thermodesulfobacteriota bacterium]|nr:MAG: signal peptidase I [Thermodesulfobacteriota bacterium]
MSAKKERLWEAYLEEKGKAWLKVESGSMLPMIPVGANILIKRCDFKEIKPSDIVVFKSKGKFIVHRVLRKNRDKLLQAGDNFSLPSLIHKENILGRVVLIKDQKYVIDLEKKKNRILNIVISAIYVLAHKIPSHKYWLLRINNKLMGLLRESRTKRCQNASSH